MTEIVCFRCGKKPIKRLLNGEYWCGQCNKSYSAAETKAYFIERMKETEQRMLQKVCVTCGRPLIKPGWTMQIEAWCSWCDREPESGEHISSEIRDRINAIDAVIAEGEHTLFRKARLGDKEAIASIFEEALEWEPTLKSLIGLGTVAVDFFINKLGRVRKVKVPSSREEKLWGTISGDEVTAVEVKAIAARALGEIGDERAVASLIEAIATAGAAEGSINVACYLDLADAALEAVDKIGTSRAFVQLLSILEGNYRASGSLQDSRQFQILNTLNKILERAARDIPENDLITASKIKDVSVRHIRYENHEVETENAYGHVTYRPWHIVTDALDCSSLRLAAQREIKSRGSTGCS